LEKKRLALLIRKKGSAEAANFRDGGRKNKGKKGTRGKGKESSRSSFEKKEKPEQKEESKITQTTGIDRGRNGPRAKKKPR